MTDEITVEHILSEGDESDIVRLTFSGEARPAQIGETIRKIREGMERESTETEDADVSTWDESAVDPRLLRSENGFENIEENALLYQLSGRDDERFETLLKERAKADGRENALRNSFPYFPRLGLDPSVLE